jgi:hypothetical protein
MKEPPHCEMSTVFATAAWRSAAQTVEENCQESLRGVAVGTGRAASRGSLGMLEFLFS